MNQLRHTIVPVTPFMQNTTILWDDVEHTGVITDVGGDISKIESVLDTLNITLQSIWLTHGHIDHIGAVAEFSKKYNLPIIGPHREDEFWIQALPIIAGQYGFPSTSSFTPSQWLEEDDVLHIGNIQFKAIHAPGHTPGSIVFYSESEKLLLAGDVLFKESIGRTDFPKGNHTDLIHSIKSKILTLPDDVNVISGHGPMTTIGHEKRYNPFLS